MLNTLCGGFSAKVSLGTPAPLALCPALQFVEDFFVNFSILLIFGVYKNQLSLVVIISDNYINQIVNKILVP